MLRKLNSLVAMGRGSRKVLCPRIRRRRIAAARRQQQWLLRRSHPQHNVEDQADTAEARQQHEYHPHQCWIPSIGDSNSLAHARDDTADAWTHQTALSGSRWNCVRTVESSAYRVAAVRTVPGIGRYWFATTAAVMSHRRFPLHPNGYLIYSI
jgi:hypothetical protein